MKKIVILIGILSFAFFACKKDGVEQVNPDWINSMADTLKTKDFYWGSIIYRHEWKSKYYYDLWIPLSSCAYCNVYNEKGEKVNWDNENSQDYMQNRKNDLILWEWNDK
jgi:hypothetical protein